MFVAGSLPLSYALFGSPIADRSIADRSKQQLSASGT
jgi:hypothetical protein